MKSFDLGICKYRNLRITVLGNKVDGWKITKLQMAKLTITAMSLLGLLTLCVCVGGGSSETTEVILHVAHPHGMYFSTIFRYYTLKETCVTNRIKA